MPPFLKGTKKGETTCNFKFFFAHFQSQTTFTSMTHVYLLPGWMTVPSFLFRTSPLGGGGDTSTTSGDGEVSPPPPGTIRLPPFPHHYKQKGKKPSVNT